jgi:hypothetical protein
MRRLPLAAFLLCTACYAHAAIEPAAVGRGTAVRARVTGAGADRIAPLLGTTNARVVSGRLVDMRADTLIVEVPTVMQASLAGSAERLHQRVSIPRTELIELETRRLDRFRTTAVVGTAALAVAAIAVKALRNERGGPGTPPGGGGNEARIPLVKLGW